MSTTPDDAAQFLGELPAEDGSAEANTTRVEFQPGVWADEYNVIPAWSEPLVRAYALAAVQRALAAQPDIAQAVAAERERCAKLIEHEAVRWRGVQDISDFRLCAALVRAAPQQAAPEQRFTRADLLEAVATERHACSIAVWMTLQDALQPGADDKGLDGWMREAEARVKNRLAHHQEQAAPAAPAPEAVQPIDTSAQRVEKSAEPAHVQPLAVRLTREQIDAVMTQHYPLDSLLRENVDAFEACLRDAERLMWAPNGLRGE